MSVSDAFSGGTETGTEATSTPEPSESFVLLVAVLLTPPEELVCPPPARFARMRLRRKKNRPCHH